MRGLCGELAPPEFLVKHFGRGEPQPTAEHGSAFQGFGGAADVHDWPYGRLLALRHAAAQMECLSRPFAPLAQRGITDACQLPLGFPLEDGHQGDAMVACDARVPDRPAESCLNSFIAAVDGKHDGQAAGKHPGEPRVHGLD